MIKEIFGGKIKLQFGKEDELYHYQITPYNYKPKVAKKISPKTYHDLGQGLMDQIYDLELLLNKKENKVTLRKRKK